MFSRIDTPAKMADTQHAYTGFYSFNSYNLITHAGFGLGKIFGMRERGAESKDGVCIISVKLKKNPMSLKSVDYLV